jgi:O-6-methylguanine DNA methyltransferase
MTTVQPTRQPLVATAVEGPWGPTCIAASEQGVVALALMADPEAFAVDLERRFGRAVGWYEPGDTSGPGREARAFVHLTVATALVERVLSSEGDDIQAADAGAVGELATLSLDLEDRPAWDRAVLDAVRAIPCGETRSYGDIARAIGRPGAARAVGGAVGRNPIGLVIPCHRVIAGDGTLGGYGGGWWGERDRLLDLKAELLAREGVQLRRSRSGA